MKKWIAFTMALAMSLTIVGCGGNGGGNTTDERIMHIDGLADDLYPNLERMDASGDNNFAGSVDVDIVFGKTKPGWEAVEKAYEKIQTGVDVRLNAHSDGTYLNDVTNAVNNANTDWDIFQGNRVSNVSSAAINLSSQLFDENHYAGKEIDDPDVEEGASKMWQSVLSTDAYITDKSGSNTACYIMNSESLSTAWFVNETAFKAAVEKGRSGQSLRRFERSGLHKSPGPCGRQRVRQRIAVCLAVPRLRRPILPRSVSEYQRTGRGRDLYGFQSGIRFRSGRSAARIQSGLQSQSYAVLEFPFG